MLGNNRIVIKNEEASQVSETIMANTKIKVCAKLDNDGEFVNINKKSEEGNRLPFWIITLPVTLGGLIVLSLSLAALL